MPPRRRDAEVVFFIDRCLGQHTVPDGLRKVGARVELHSDHFPPEAPDTEILSVIGTNGWVFLSKDTRVRRRKAEIHALTEARVAAFIITSGNATGPALADALVKAVDRMLAICGTHTRPIIGTVGMSGSVSVLVGERRGGIRR